MRYGVAIPHANRFASPAAIRSVAGALEDLGFDSVWVSDHIVVPEGHRYIPEYMDEPLAVLSYLAAATTHVQIGTSVLIVPYRDPVFTAKFLATVDVLSAGRVVAGVGIGWLEEEFRALGVPYTERASMTDEYLRAMRNLWETETSSFRGRHRSYENLRMFPKKAPDRPGTIPIVVGGNSPGAVRRAAELGDGWHPINLRPGELREGVTSYHEACRRAGTEPGPVSLRILPGRQASEDRPPLTGSPREQAVDLRDYRDAGLDELVLWPVARTPPELVAQLRSFMREVVPHA